MEISQQTADFIAAHAGDDVRLLALKADRTKGVDLAFALNQIACMQTARRKLPSWCALGIVYPPALSMEQCSGEQTAGYKARVAARLAANGRFADITGGFGVDFAFIAKAIGGHDGCGCVYVEKMEALCECAANNFPLLGLAQAEVTCADGTQYIRDTDGTFELIYLDPARRDIQGRRTYDIRDCTPNVIALMPTLLGKAPTVMLKLSPMLDWRKAVADLDEAAGASRGRVAEVHVISVGNECKELLFIVRNVNVGQLQVFCVNDASVFQFAVTRQPSAMPGMPVSESTLPYSAPTPGCYLFEPNSSIMKAGCHDCLSAAYRLAQISANSHLYVSHSPVAAFPGRSFIVEAVTTMNRQQLRRSLQGITRANVTVRNFPLTVAELRKRLKLKDGGDKYIFATTLADSAHCLLICRRA